MAADHDRRVVRSARQRAGTLWAVASHVIVASTTTAPAASRRAAARSDGDILVGHDARGGGPRATCRRSCRAPLRLVVARAGQARATTATAPAARGSAAVSDGQKSSSPRQWKSAMRPRRSRPATGARALAHEDDLALEALRRRCPARRRTTSTAAPRPRPPGSLRGSVRRRPEHFEAHVQEADRAVCSATNAQTASSSGVPATRKPSSLAPIPQGPRRCASRTLVDRIVDLDCGARCTGANSSECGAWHREADEGARPSTFAMARRRSSQLSYIRRSPSIAERAWHDQEARPPPALRRRCPMRAIDDILDRLGLDRSALTGGDLEVRTPITGETLAHITRTDAAGTDAAIARRRPRSSTGETSRLRAVASSRGCSARSCAARRRRSARSSRSRPARSRRRASARSRR